jgi:hypothetical protein
MLMRKNFTGTQSTVIQLGFLAAIAFRIMSFSPGGECQKEGMRKTKSATLDPQMSCLWLPLSTSSFSPHFGLVLLVHRAQHVELVEVLCEF